jgi:preprotein translocase subunit YajC
VTIGGLHGVVDTINNADKTVVIDSDGIYLTFNLGAIRNVTPGNGAAAVENNQPAAATTDDTASDSAADTTASDDSSDKQTDDSAKNE